MHQRQGGGASALLLPLEPKHRFAFRSTENEFASARDNANAFAAVNCWDAIEAKCAIHAGVGAQLLCLLRCHKLRGCTLFASERIEKQDIAAMPSCDTKCCANGLKL